MMRSLTEVAHQCEMKLIQLGIPIQKPQKYTVNMRAKTRWGQCKLIKQNITYSSIGAPILVKPHYEININAALLNESVSLISLENTIMHELIHTCEGCMNHGPQWKKWADVVNKSLPDHHISRTESCTEKGLSDYHSEDKYQLKCQGCGIVIGRSRRSDFVSHYYNYRCAKCHGSFIRIK